MPMAQAGIRLGRIRPGRWYRGPDNEQAGDARRLLLVEDSVTNQLVASTLLKIAGYRVDIASNGSGSRQSRQGHAFRSGPDGHRHAGNGWHRRDQGDPRIAGTRRPDADHRHDRQRDGR